MAVMAMVIIIEVAVIMVVVIVVTVVVAVIMAAAVVMAPGKGSEKNPKKSSPRRKEKLPLGLLMRDGARIGVKSTPIDISPA